jgi:RNA-directed DNA polymerase
MKAGKSNRGDPVEGRGHLNKEPMEGNTMGTQEPKTRQEAADYVLTKRYRIAEIAKNLPEERLVSLSHHIDLWWMNEAFRRTRKDGAVGIDRQTAEDYRKNLRANLENLLERAKSGAYRAPPVRRVHIPKPGGKETRPIGIPTFEDKVLQRAVVMVLEPIYEQSFYDFSFGFRPGRSQHQTLRKLREGLWKNKGGWVIDLDIRKFFDTLNHGKLREILGERIGDGVIRKLIDKWLKAGVMENGEVSYNDEGTPQGGVISPLLSNIYLHEVLDEWFIKIVQPRMQGKSFMVRFADDAVLGFETKADAQRVMAVLPKRFEKYGLTVHPEKTKLIDMRMPVETVREERSGNDERQASFAFLGFRHYWAMSRKGYWVIKRKTDPSRLARSIKKVIDWIKENRHISLGEQQAKLCTKLRGHYGYYGITSNFRSLKLFFNEVLKGWRKWLARRSRDGTMSWEKLIEHLKRYPLTVPRIVHSNV